MSYREAVRDNYYNDTFLFYFERKFDRPAETLGEMEWILKNWQYSIYYSIIYVVLVFIGGRIMKNRERIHLSRSLIAWNILHSIFSVLGAIRLVPIFVKMIHQKGLDYSICEAEYDLGVIGEWSSLFVVTKVVDLFDTAFIILRKQKLLFLHWYHHAASLMYTWYSLKDLSSTGRFFSVMNISAHALMYPYYVCRSLKIKIPKFIMISITSLQTIQMVVGVYVNMYALVKKNRGGYCRVSYDNIYWSFAMYFTFFMLFANFFVNRYLSNGVGSIKGFLKRALNASNYIYEKLARKEKKFY